jgi:GntR family transcriptional regulator
LRREPAYQTLASDLRAAIRENRYADGQRLPTEAELSARHRVSRQTVRRAYQDLVAEGIVRRIPGKGTFPAAHGQYLRSFGSIEDLLALSLDTDLEVIKPLELVSRPEAATILGLQFDEVIEVSLRRLHDGLPFCQTTVSLPPGLGRRLQQARVLTEPGVRSRSTVIGLLERVLGESITGAKMTITAVSAPAAIGPLIDCEVDEPMMRTERLYFNAEGRPVELAVAHFNPARYSYRLRLQRTAE